MSCVRAKLEVVSEQWINGELLAFDLETTGVDKLSDLPVSFALVTFEAQQVRSARYSLVNPGREIPSGAVAVHGISTERAQAEGMGLEDAIEEIADALVDASHRNVPVVGFNLSYDLTMIDARCRAVDRRGLVERGWKGPVLDPLVIDRGLDRYRKGPRTLGALCDRYEVINAAAHDAQGDAIASCELLLAMVNSLPELQTMDLSALYAQQAAWHKSWAGGFSDFLMSKGGKGFADEEFLWPLQLLSDSLF